VGRLHLPVVFVCVLACACAADSGGSGRSGGGSSGSGGSGGGTSGTGTAGDDGFGNSDRRTAGGTGGSGGTGVIDGDGSCAAQGAEAEVGRQGTDIVWVVDNSCSMAVEAAAVQANMNRFTQLLSDRGIDVNLTLISSSQVGDPNMACPAGDFVCLLNTLIAGFNFGVCISAPFGSGNCPADSKPPNYLHIDFPVGSNNGLQLMLDNYASYASMLRPTTSKHFVIVTDDNADIGSAQFMQQMTAKDPTLLADFDFHGIFAQTQCIDAAQVGTVYQELVDQTGGVASDLCTQVFDPVFDQLAMDVAMKADFACDWPIPAAPAGQTLDPNLVNVQFTPPGGSVVSLGKIPSGEDCAGREGWFYDDDSAPTTVHACPASCDIFRDGGGKVDVLFGCNTVVVE